MSYVRVRIALSHRTTRAVQSMRRSSCLLLLYTSVAKYTEQEHCRSQMMSEFSFRFRRVKFAFFSFLEILATVS